METVTEPAPPPPTSAAEDRVLVERAQAGDTRAFDELVRKYTPKLYGLVYNMTSNREDTADLLQEIFAKAYRSVKRFQGKSSFYTWIYSISVNMTLNFLKKRGFSKAESGKIIEKVLMEEGRPPESIFDFIQGITRLARDKTQQDARLDMESRAKKLLDRVS